MAERSETIIVTGASQGIGAGIVGLFLDRGYNVVASARRISDSGAFPAVAKLALVDGDIGDPQTAARIAQTAIDRFGSIDALVNNAGIFFTKPFIDYTADDFRSLVSTNLEGFLYLTQLVIRRMLSQNRGGSIVTVTASLVDNPIVGVTAAVPMITKGGLNAVTHQLAIEYARAGIRVNAVAPGVVATPLHGETPPEALKQLSPMGRVSTVEEIAAAVLYLTEAPSVTGEILHVDGGAHRGKW
jgi:NAD(P)-dependent dehydrogenase (short-subunit alcohol dehydrogenase family)